MCKTSVVSVVIITIVKILKSEKLDLVLIPIFEKGFILTKHFGQGFYTEKYLKYVTIAKSSIFDV